LCELNRAQDLPAPRAQDLQSLRAKNAVAVEQESRGLWFFALPIDACHDILPAEIKKPRSPAWAEHF
jgi:hypothetical protein